MRIQCFFQQERRPLLVCRITRITEIVKISFLTLFFHKRDSPSLEAGLISS